MLCVYLNLQAIKREPLQKQIFLDISHTHTQKCFQFNRENVRYCYLDYIYLLGMSGPTLLYVPLYMYCNDLICRETSEDNSSTEYQNEEYIDTFCLVSYSRFSQ